MINQDSEAGFNLRKLLLKSFRDHEKEIFKYIVKTCLGKKNLEKVSEKDHDVTEQFLKWLRRSIASLIDNSDCKQFGSFLELYQFKKRIESTVLQPATNSQEKWESFSALSPKFYSDKKLNELLSEASLCLSKDDWFILSDSEKVIFNGKNMSFKLVWTFW